MAEQEWAKVIGIQDRVWVLTMLDEAPDFTRCVPGHYVVKDSDEDWTSGKSVEVKQYQVPDYRVARDL